MNVPEMVADAGAAGAAPGRLRNATLVRRSLLASAGLRERLQDIATRTGASLPPLVREAGRYLREMVPGSSALGYRLLIRFSRFFYQRGYDYEIACDAGEIERLRALIRKHPVALISNHRSQVDGFAIYCALHDHQLPHPFAFGGINMKLPVMGPILKASGLVFLRRSFQDNPVYKAVLRSYIDFLTEHRFPLLWAIEGTRSRTGKLAAPRFGLISWVLNAEHPSAREDLQIVPVALSYEQIADVQAFAAEQRGARKRPENFRWLLRYLGSISHPMGTIAVRFGQPVSVGEQLQQLGREDPALLEQPDKALLRIVIAACVQLNEATPVTAPSLVCLVLLQAVPKAVTRRELEREYLQLCGYVESQHWPTTLRPAGQPLVSLEAALLALTQSGVIECFTGGYEPVYSIVSGQELSAAYYRNNSIHFFVTGAIAEVALGKALAQRDATLRRATFHDEVVHLRQLFKFEFYFPLLPLLFERLHADLDRRAPEWRQVMDSPDSQPGRELKVVSPLLCHGVLECFVEAYQVVAEHLARAPADAPCDPQALLDQCLGEAEQLYRLRRITHAETVARPMLESGLLAARSRGLLDGNAAAEQLRAGRRAFRDEMHELSTRLQEIRHIAALRRADH
jgi:glycerol-3-phosphate O-acyltransferase